MKKTTVEIDIKEGNPILLDLNDRGIKPYIVVDDEVYVHLSILLATANVQATTEEMGDRASEDDEDHEDHDPNP